MPSTSWKQHKFMTAIEHSASFAKKVGVPQKVGRDFAKADNRVGITKHPDQRSSGPKAGITVHPDPLHKNPKI